MKIERTVIGYMKKTVTHEITAEEGKTLRRISDGWMPGKSLVLGYTSYLFDGTELPEPLLELPEHYEEIDKPEEKED